MPSETSGRDALFNELKLYLPAELAQPSLPALADARLLGPVITS